MNDFELQILLSLLVGCATWWKCPMSRIPKSLGWLCWYSKNHLKCHFLDRFQKNGNQINMPSTVAWPTFPERFYVRCVTNVENWRLNRRYLRWRCFKQIELQGLLMKYRRTERAHLYESYLFNYWHNIYIKH